jgi:hypothetical protein
MGVGEIVLVSVVAFVLLVLGPILLVTVTWLRRLRDAALQEALALGEPLRLEPQAHLVGRTSLGVGQARGNGCLSLTRDRLLFVQWVPRRTIAIDRSSITSVSRVDSHLGKRTGTPFLLVAWEDDTGADSAAFRVVDLDAWERAIDARAQVPG